MSMFFLVDGIYFGLFECSLRQDRVLLHVNISSVMTDDMFGMHLMISRRNILDPNRLRTMPDRPMSTLVVLPIAPYEH